MSGRTASPEHYAQALLKHVGGREPVRLADVAKKIGLQIEYVDSTGFDGALVRFAGLPLGVVAVRKTMEKSRRRFTTAHEMGHYILPGHDIAVCKSLDVGTVGESTNQLERDANKFARELLMPSSVVGALVKRYGVSMETCKFVRDQFDVSLTAAAARVIEVTKRRAALVVTEKGIRKRYQPSRRLSAKIYQGVPLSPHSLASKLTARNLEMKGQVPLQAWIETTSDDLMIDEDSLLMPKSETILTLLIAP